MAGSVLHSVHHSEIVLPALVMEAEIQEVLQAEFRPAIEIDFVASERDQIVFRNLAYHINLIASFVQCVLFNAFNRCIQWLAGSAEHVGQGIQ